MELRIGAPRSAATEEVLAGIYGQMFGVERVGVEESFFELGGDSILSMQVVARARAAGLGAGRVMCSWSRRWPGWPGWHGGCWCRGCGR